MAICSRDTRSESTLDFACTVDYFRGGDPADAARASLVPPDAVLKSFFKVYPEFVVHRDGRIGSGIKLDYRNVLAPTERSLVDVLRGTPACLVDRATFWHRSIDLGLKRGAFSQYLTFSRVISRVGTGLWSLPGVRPESIRTVPRRILQGRTSPAKTVVLGSVHPR